MKRYALALMLAASSQLLAFDMGDCGCGSFGVYGEALYMRASVCELGYAIADPTYTTRENNDFPVGRHMGAGPDYEWGFGLAGEWVTGDGCNDVRVEYSRLHTNYSDSRCVGPHDGGYWITVTGKIEDFPVVTEVDGHNGFVFGKSKLEWNEVRGTLASRKVKDCDLYVRTSLGLQWTEIKVNRKASYERAIVPGASSLVKGKQSDHVSFLSLNWKQHSKSWGVGPRAGVDARYDIACGFGIGGRAGVAILAGESDVKSELDFDNASSVTDQSIAICSKGLLFPALDARMGLNYVKECECFALLLEIGYEFRTYINAVIQPLIYADDDTGAMAKGCESFNLNGLYIQAGVAF